MIITIAITINIWNAFAILCALFLQNVVCNFTQKLRFMLRILANSSSYEYWVSLHYLMCAFHFRMDKLHTKLQHFVKQFESFLLPFIKQSW